jgi:hypothetical protein
MLRIFTANDHHNAVAPDDFAMLTTRFYRGTYFHELALHNMYRQNSPRGTGKRSAAGKDIHHVPLVYPPSHQIDAIHKRN